jgi:hypothetical protein
MEEEALAEQRELPVHDEQHDHDHPRIMPARPRRVSGRLAGMSRLVAPAALLFLVACAEPPDGPARDAQPTERPDATAAVNREGGSPPDAREAGPPDVLGPDGAPDVLAPRPEAGDVVAAPCPEVPLDMSWMGQYQRDLLARLTGELEVEPGLKLANRGTPATRMAARRYLEASLRALGLEPASHSYATGANVYARLDSTTGGAEHVVLGAHYDTVVRTPGANDNATGVALVMAAGKALGKLGCRSRPILLVFFDEEEMGLVGAKAFARKLVADGTMVHSVHTADQLGWDSDGDGLIELERPDTGLRALYETAQRSLGLSFRLVNTTTSGSDHSAFRPTFKAIGLTEGYDSGDTSPHRHSPQDTLATVDLAYLARATTLVARTMADLLR